MKLLMSVCGVIATLSIVGIAAGQEKDEAKKDLDKMQGSWRVVSWQMADEKKAGDEVKKMNVTVKGNTLIYESGEQRKKGEGPREGTIKLDPKTKAFDWNLTDLGTNMLAIYELKGDDLKIGFGNDGLIRPKLMEMGKENVVWLLVLKRDLIKEARRDTEATLNDLCAGKYDNDPQFAPVARKVKGFRSWSIETQEIVPNLPKAVRFGGTLKGPNGEATFTATMVKQQNGKWMIGTFEGPNPK